MASFGESLIPVDADGRPLTPAIARHDQRTRAEMRWLDEEFGEAALFLSIKAAVLGQPASRQGFTAV